MHSNGSGPGTEAVPTEQCALGRLTERSEDTNLALEDFGEGRKEF
jgi:hypothetical protein